jgi:glycosyltransferase involved in cell wall biosynthesis
VSWRIVRPRLRPDPSPRRNGLLISVIVPAYNEAAVIGRSLRALTEGCAPGELEVLVVCNGCRDNTAEAARAVGGPVRVLETDVPSKTNALNLGDAAATGFPRVYMDADVVVDLSSIRRLVRAFDDPAVLAAAPRPVDVFAPDVSGLVRAYYRFWMSLPYVQEGMIAAGVYALSAAGRARFGAFPDIIADDGYVRLQFAPSERVQVADAESHVRAPTTFHDLLKIKTRSRFGVLQLRQRFPDLYGRETRTKDYGGALWAILRRPKLYSAALTYVVLTVLARLRADRQFRRAQAYVWERDDSSRAPQSAS